MAINTRTLADADGDYPDWIEIHNPEPVPVSLAGWYLTDTATNLTRWQFPDVTLAPDEYRVVFASDKDRRNPAGELHTNFKLSGSGEFLALVKPDGVTIASAFAPAFPVQLEDYSYGVAGQAGLDAILVPTNSMAGILVPSGPVEEDWQVFDFTPGPEWMEGRTGIGYQAAAARSARILLVADTHAGGTGQLGNEELADHLVTDLGHQVTWVDDDQAAAGLATDQDLIFVAAIVDPAKVNALFRDAELPIIIAHAGLVDDYGLSAPGTVLPEQTTVTVTAAGADHPMLAGLPAGTHAVRATPATFHTASASQLAPGAQVLATAANGQPAIILIEPGHRLNDGSAAPGRRIFTFLGESAVAGLNRAGIALFDAMVAQALAGRELTTSFARLIKTDVEAQMAGVNSSVLIRLPFEPAELPPFDSLQLRMRYADGFVAFLNGVEVARRNAPPTPVWNSAALSPRPALAAKQVEVIELSAFLPLLHPGGNVLGIQGLSTGPADPEALLLPELVAHASAVRTERYYTTPTPGAANTTGADGLVPPVEFSVERGYFNAPFELALSTAMSQAEIRYTTNGSPPGPTTGWVYERPITVTHTLVVRAAAYRPGYLAAPPRTMSYLFVDDVVNQPRDVPGWPRPTLSVGRGTRQHDYEMDPRITRAPDYTNDLISGLFEIPTLSIAVHQPDMWDADGNGGFFRLYDYEKPASLELFLPGAPEKTAVADCGIQGHSHDRLKRSLRLSFKALYGPTRFESTLFTDAPVQGAGAARQTDSIVLRGGNNRCWARSWNPDRTTYTEDEWYRSSQIAMSGIGAHGNFVHLYINGLYWGLFNPVERPDAGFAASYLGGDKDDWFSVSHGGTHGGDPARWNYLKGALTDQDMSVPANYAELTHYLAVGHFVDYLLLSWYIGMTDWPQNNWWGANCNNPPGPFYFFAWDGEWSFGVGSSPLRAWVHPDFRANVSSSSRPIAKIWHAARRNREFMMLVADRAFANTCADGALGDAPALERWRRLNDYVRNPVVAESARWGDAMDAGSPRTRDVEWQNEVHFMEGLLAGNGAQLIAALREQGFYPSIDPPVLTPSGGRFPGPATVTLANPNATGTLYFTTDGSDPRRPGGAVNPAARTTATFTFDRSTRINARVLDGGEWSALNSRAFIVEQRLPLAITELMYHPAEPDPAERTAGWTNAEVFEFIELFNAGTNSVDLAGLHFTEGLSFTFTNGLLAPGDYTVLVRDPAAFAHRYGPDRPVAGVFTGALDNAGERLRLEDGFGEVVLDFTYDDLWRPGTDGSGPSLVLLDPEAANTWGTAAGWRASAQPGGSPGEADPLPANSTFALWRVRHFSPAELADQQLGGLEGDLDGDGLLNLLEYALDRDPRQTETTPLLTVNLEAGVLTVTYQRSRTASDVTFEIQAADNLGGPWGADGLTEQVIRQELTSETVQVRDQAALSRPRSFLRLRIQPLF